MGSTLETLRATVAALRQVTGQSQAEIAAGVGLTQEKVSRRQSGATAWTLDEVDALAGHFRIPVLALLAGPTRACEALEAVNRMTAVTTVEGESGVR
jgi:hypothetical protein